MKQKLIVAITPKDWRAGGEIAELQAALSSIFSLCAYPLKMPTDEKTPKATVLAFIFDGSWEDDGRITECIRMATRTEGPDIYIICLTSMGKMGDAIKEMARSSRVKLAIVSTPADHADIKVPIGARKICNTNDWDMFAIAHVLQK